MTLATEKEKEVSSRFTLVRLEPARFISSDLVSQGGGVYEVTFTDIKHVSKVQRNGSDLTLVTTLVNNNEYTYNFDTGVLQVKLSSAPNSTSNVIVAFHHLFITNGEGQYLPVGPTSATSASNPERFWEPRLQGSPAIEESFRNIINGVFTIKGSSLSVNNADRWLNPFIGVNDSFKNKAVDIYISMNGVIEQIFSGPGNNVSIRDNNATISFRDAFSPLNRACDFGDGFHLTYYNNAVLFADLDPRDYFRPVPMVIGGSPATHRDRSRVSTTSYVASPDKKMAEVAGFLKAANIDFAANPGAGPTYTTNREFHLGRSLTEISDQTIGTFVRQTTSTIDGDTVHYYYFTGHNLKIGQTFKWFASGSDRYAIVHHVGDFTFSGNTYNVMVANNASGNLTDPVMTAGSQFRSLKSLVVVRFISASGTLAQFSHNYLKQEEDYTVSLNNLTAGLNYNHTIELDSSVSFTPDTDVVYYSIECEDATHGAALKKIVGQAGITTSDATFTQADSDLTASIRTSYPRLNGSKGPGTTYRQIAEDICASCLTYLYQTNTGQAAYSVLEAPSATDTRDSDLVLDGSLSVSIDYNDIATKIEYQNPSAIVLDTTDVIGSESSSKAEYLHGEENVVQFEHVLEDISGRISAHLALWSSRQAEYTYDVATQDIDAELGEDVTISSDKITKSGTQDVKITGIRRSSSRIQVKAMDLGDLS